MKIPFKLELFIATRYILSKKRDQFISFISIASMLGISIGVATLIIVMSVMNGFQKELKEKILGVVLGTLAASYITMIIFCIYTYFFFI